MSTTTASVEVWTLGFGGSASVELAWLEKEEAILVAGPTLVQPETSARCRKGSSVTRAAFETTACF